MLEEQDTGSSRRPSGWSPRGTGHVDPPTPRDGSDSLNDDEAKKPWHARKRRYVAGLRDPDEKSDDALLVTAADKIHNALSIARDLRTFGLQFWSTFNVCEHDLLWYYTDVEAAIADRLGAHTIVGALHRAVDELIAASKTDRDAAPREPSDGSCPRHPNAESAA